MDRVKESPRTPYTSQSSALSIELAQRVRHAFRLLEKHSQQWKSCNSGGVESLTSLINLQLKQSYSHMNDVHWGSLSEFDGLKEAMGLKIAARAQPIRRNLDSSFSKQVEALQWMQVALDTLRRADERALNEGGVAFRDSTPLCKVMSISKMVLLGEEIVSMYSQELFLKGKILDDLSDQRDQETLTLYAGTWLLQPYVDTTRVDEILDLVRTEIGDLAAFQSPFVQRKIM
eukprot:TRINITY_DN1623_c0_g1::TRINITY_DN1623_c0_g1_i1::g.17900::m.17900 TRINITY_DN1623_c0_g1::TRINITY_DN1623_c0_g1_i1::g.17900  ORF type:complete len:231 (+),score=22.67,CK2S/PF15011.1/8.6e-06 TRINITY_DN1623_c0_g1_i1:40-732(+)